MRTQRRSAAALALAAMLAGFGAAALALAAMLAGCGTGASTMTGLPPDVIPVPAGRTAAYRLPALSAATRRRAPVGGLRCTRSHPRVFGAHVDLYAHRLVVPIPAGIGIAPPQRRAGAYVRGGACAYPLRTYEPTGVIAVNAGSALTLAQLFALWGQPLGTADVAGFHGRVITFLNGRRWRGSPGTIPLSRHAEVVIEVDGYVAPHPRYRFEPGL
jgi:hypothetical protein